VCSLAKERRPRAMILMSTFTSIRAMARRFLFPGSLIVDAFDNEATLRALDVPVWILHGDRDVTVPVSHGERLASVGRRARLTIEHGAGHNDCPRDWRRHYRDVEAFLRESGVL
jgi:pimeloyl-ACP methyl ester carboxylesterase